MEALASERLPRSEVHPKIVVGVLRWFRGAAFWEEPRGRNLAFDAELGEGMDIEAACNPQWWVGLFTTGQVPTREIKHLDERGEGDKPSHPVIALAPCVMQTPIRVGAELAWFHSVMRSHSKRTVVVKFDLL